MASAQAASAIADMLRFGVWGLGFGVWGLGFGVWSLGFESLVALPLTTFPVPLFRLVRLKRVERGATRAMHLRATG